MNAIKWIRLLGFWGYIKSMLLFPIFLVHHYLIFLPQIKKEAELQGLTVDEYVMKIYHPIEFEPKD